MVSALLAASVFLVAFSVCADMWMQFDKGLHVGEFRSPQKSIFRNSIITIIKIDPDRFTFKLLCAKESGLKGMPVKTWCRKFKLLGGVNAGMYQTDFLSNVGYMKNFTHINNARVASRFLSVFACNPVMEGMKRAKVFDIDETDMSDIIKKYNTVIQNLRLIKRNGENRWSKQLKIWSEVALGENSKGNILFIYSPVPYSMHEFNEILLALPVDVLCAQHLEGGPEASLYFKYKDFEIEKCGHRRSRFDETDQGCEMAAIPNVLGFSR
jgi:hypothetical protein